jgi:hypothetical protein
MTTTKAPAGNPNPYTISVPASAVAAISHKFGLFARRCVKLGMVEPQLVEGAHTFVPDFAHAPRNTNPGSLPQIEMVELTLLATAVMAMGGWRLLGRVDRLPDGRPLVARTPGTEGIALPDIRDAGDCDHCRKVRVRTETFLVANLDGRVSQVGRNCLADFLGHDPKAALRQAQLIDEFTSTWGTGAWGPTPELLYDTAAVLALAARVASHGGYLGTTKAAEINEEIESQNLLRPHAVSTRAHVVERLIRLRAMSRKEQLERAAFEAAWDARYPDDAVAAALSAEMSAGIAEAAAHPGSEWEANVAAVVSTPHLRDRHFGVAISAAVMGLRRQERPAKVAHRPSVHLGVVGERINLPAEIVFTRVFDGDFGTRTLLKFQAAEGTLLWWATGIPTKPAAEGPDGTMTESGPWAVGDLVTLTGTVKAHEADRWSGQPTTLFTRVKLVLRAPEPAAETELDPAAVTAILDAIPGAYESAQAGLAEARAGHVIPLADL